MVRVHLVPPEIVCAGVSYNGITSGFEPDDMGSIPVTPALCPCSLTDRTTDYESDNGGSIPSGDIDIAKICTRRKIWYNTCT